MFSTILAVPRSGLAARRLSTFAETGLNAEKRIQPCYGSLGSADPSGHWFQTELSGFSRQFTTQSSLSMSAPALRIEGPRGSIEADWVPGRTWLSSYCGTPGLLLILITFKN